jgi:hypothetical protein
VTVLSCLLSEFRGTVDRVMDVVYGRSNRSISDEGMDCYRSVIVAKKSGRQVLLLVIFFVGSMQSK